MTRITETTKVNEIIYKERTSTESLSTKREHRRNDYLQKESFDEMIIYKKRAWIDVTADVKHRRKASTEQQSCHTKHGVAHEAAGDTRWDERCIENANLRHERQ